MPSGVKFEGYFSSLIMTFVVSRSLCVKSEKSFSRLQPVTDSQTQFVSVPTHLFLLLHFNSILAECVYRDTVGLCIVLCVVKSYFLCGASDSSEQELSHNDTLFSFLSKCNVFYVVCFRGPSTWSGKQVLNCQFFKKCLPQQEKEARLLFELVLC